MAHASPVYPHRPDLTRLRRPAAPTVPRPGTTARRELRQRLERESALVQTRVRHRQARLGRRLVAVEEQIEVDRPRAVASAVARHAAERALDLEQRVEELLRARARSRAAAAPLRNARLVDVPPRFRLAQARDGDDSTPSRSPSSSSARRMRRLAVAEVRPEADIGARAVQRERRNDALNASPCLLRRVERNSRALVSLSRLLPSRRSSPSRLAGGSTRARLGSGTLVQLTPGSAAAERQALVRGRRARRRAKLRLWRLDAAAATASLPGLRARGALAAQ